MKLKEEKEEEKNLWRKGAGGGEFVANEIAGGDVRDAEKVGEAASVGSFSDAGAAQEHPLNAPVAPIVTGRRRRRVRVDGGGKASPGEGRDGGGDALGEAGYGRHGIDLESERVLRWMMINERHGELFLQDVASKI